MKTFIDLKITRKPKPTKNSTRPYLNEIPAQKRGLTGPILLTANLLFTPTAFFISKFLIARLTTSRSKFSTLIHYRQPRVQVQLYSTHFLLPFYLALGPSSVEFDIPFELFQLSPRVTSLRVGNAAEAKLGRLMCQVHT